MPRFTASVQRIENQNTWYLTDHTGGQCLVEVRELQAQHRDNLSEGRREFEVKIRYCTLDRRNKPKSMMLTACCLPLDDNVEVTHSEPPSRHMLDYSVQNLTENNVVRLMFNYKSPRAFNNTWTTKFTFENVLPGTILELCVDIEHCQKWYDKLTRNGYYFCEWAPLHVRL